MSEIRNPSPSQERYCQNIIMFFLKIILTIVYTLSIGWCQEVNLPGTPIMLSEGTAQEICVEVSNSGLISGTARVTLTTEDGPNTFGGADYISLSQTLIFTRTTNIQCVRIETIQDDTVEEGEYFLVTLINPDGVSIVGAQTNITIVDDDKILVEFLTNITTVTEGFTFDFSLRNFVNVRFVRVCVSITSGSIAGGRAISVQLNTTDETAIEPDDYTISFGTLAFSNGSKVNATACNSRAISIQNDVLVEPVESFLAYLVAPDTEQVTITQDALRVIIRDNDIVTLSAVNSIVVRETEEFEQFVRVEMQLPNSRQARLVRDVVLSYRTVDRTAQVHFDYRPMSGNITFRSGSGGGSQRSLDIKTITNDIGEPDETFIISLSLLTPDRLLNNIIYVTILDDDDIDCGPPPVLENGSPQFNSTVISYTTDRMVNSTVPPAVATYVCDDGFQHTGMGNQRRCKPSGAWSNEDIRCQSAAGMNDYASIPLILLGYLLFSLIII